MFTSPIIPTITTYAAEQQSNLPYSRFWETQADGSWKYKYDDGAYATGWIQDDVDGNWYYMDSAGIMKSGLYKSYDRYYYFSEIAAIPVTQNAPPSFAGGRRAGFYRRSIMAATIRVAVATYSLMLKSRTTSTS